MTGLPAETWRRFKFATAPTWAYSLLLLSLAGGIGAIAYVITVNLVAQRASGHLPLTRSNSRLAAVMRWGPLTLAGAGVASWVLWLATASMQGQAAQAVAIASAMLGLNFFLSAFIARLVVRPLVCPRARVMEPPPGYNDKLVELRNVHPAFVAAVQRTQQARHLQRIGNLESTYLQR